MTPVSHGKPCAGNPHARFDEGASASEKPRRNALLHSIGAYVKRELGKKALHLGGITQLLFGIKGRRWDARPKYTNGLYNDAWSRPLDAERPQNFMQIESGGYW